MESFADVAFSLRNYLLVWPVVLIVNILVAMRRGRSRRCFCPFAFSHEQIHISIHPVGVEIAANDPPPTNNRKGPSSFHSIIYAQYDAATSNQSFACQTIAEIRFIGGILRNFARISSLIPFIKGLEFLDKLASFYEVSLFKYLWFLTKLLLHCNEMFQ